MRQQKHDFLKLNNGTRGLIYFLYIYSGLKIESNFKHLSQMVVNKQKFQRFCRLSSHELSSQAEILFMACFSFYHLHGQALKPCTVPGLT